MTHNGCPRIPDVARVRLLVHEARMGLLDAEVELDEIERRFRAERTRQSMAEYNLDLTGPNADASARAAEEYRAAGSYDSENYAGDGDD